MTSTETSSLSPLPAPSEPLVALVHLGCSFLVLHSLGVWLRLVELAHFGTLWVLFVGGGALALSIVWWRPLDSFVVHAGRRFFVLFCLVSVGPLWLFFYGQLRGTPATWDYFLLVGVLCFVMGPDILVLKGFIKRLLQKDSHEASSLSLRPWLWTFVAVALTLGLLPLALPYVGRLGSHVLLAMFWSLWVFSGMFLAGHKFVSLLPSLFFLLFFVVHFARPWPQAFYGNEILYTSVVAGQPVTLHAWASEQGTAYSLVTKNAILHTTPTAYRQSEMLVHPAMSVAKSQPKQILLLGSEDGAMLQELARYSHQKSVTWVPLYPFWRSFFETAPLLSRNLAYDHRFTKVHRAAAISSMSTMGLRLVMEEFGQKAFDLIIADFPNAGKDTEGLFSRESQKILLSMLSSDGLLAVNLASPYRQRALYWCLVARWARHGVHVIPFQLAPSMYRDLGLVLISRKSLPPLQTNVTIPVKTRYLPSSFPFSMLARFAKDTQPDGRFMTKLDCPFE